MITFLFSYWLMYVAMIASIRDFPKPVASCIIVAQSFTSIISFMMVYYSGRKVTGFLNYAARASMSYINKANLSSLTGTTSLT
jgi:hypothetical protein